MSKEETLSHYNQNKNEGTFYYFYFSTGSRAVFLKLTRMRITWGSCYNADSGQSEVGPEILHFQPASGDARAAVAWTIHWAARLWGPGWCNNRKKKWGGWELQRKLFTKVIAYFKNWQTAKTNKGFMLYTLQGTCLPGEVVVRVKWS